MTHELVRTQDELVLTQIRFRAGVAGLILGLVGVAGVRAFRVLRRSRPVGHIVPPARHAVLIVNPRSGDGKADRLGLLRECEARGIESLLLEPGGDLAGLAEAAVARGADVIGVAGGDGSLGPVAGVASRHNVGMVVVPTGSRNHLAMDLGLNRGDVIGALDALGEAAERYVDLGEVNGRVFVNNVSLGLYAEIIRSPEYRNAKIETTLSALSDLLGPGSRPFDLRFTGPTGEQHAGAHVVQVSNNAYSSTPGVVASRPRLDGGRLGVIAFTLPDNPVTTQRTAVAAMGHPDRLPGYVAWEPSAFVVDSDGPIDAGIDGEASRMEPPLRFAIRPGALRIRLPRHAIGLVHVARELGVRSTLRDLLRSARRPLQRLN